MKSKDIKKWVSEILEDILKENSLELFDIEYLKEGPNYYLRIYIDKENGANVKDCEVITRFISNELDKKDPIKNPYILEVGTPGLDRPLRKQSDYDKYKGQIVDIKLYKGIDGVKEFSGKLLVLEDDIVKIEVEDEQIEFEFKAIASCKLAIIF